MPKKATKLLQAGRKKIPPRQARTGWEQGQQKEKGKTSQVQSGDSDNSR